ncbi:MAG TPA: gfo/Idh/MocA family oxidoreductase, partial [Puia sp.]|nr:gfo/Idh/MocA family oxidoreductase [Puia sp.]
MHSRRSFIRQAGVMAGTSLLATTLHQKTFASFGKKMAAGDRIHVAAVGINGMGWADLLSSLKQPGVEVVMLC